MKIAQIEPLVLNVSEKTNWFFVRVTDDAGITGIGEASLNGWEPAQLAYLASISGGLVGKTAAQLVPLLRVFPHSPGGLVASSIASALEQALTDLRARQAGVPVHALLGGNARKTVRVYANINRGARDRSPDGIARAARNAVAAGFGAVKIAPFDGVCAEDFAESGAQDLIRAGIDRIYAIREAVGPDVDVMVDCHWRFDEPSALKLA
ncbi:MAG: enolase C-terminal domain-like protein, partial [Burkholderiales bacterium]